MEHIHDTVIADFIPGTVIAVGIVKNVGRLRNGRNFRFLQKISWVWAEAGFFVIRIVPRLKKSYNGVKRGGAVGMKEKKKRWKYLALLVLAVIVLAGGCTFVLVSKVGNTVKNMLDSETISDEYLDEMLASLNARDVDSAYSLFTEGIAYEEFSGGFGEMTRIWGGEKAYAFQKTGIQISISNGRKTVSCDYRIKTDDGAFRAEVVRLESEEGVSELTRFNLVRETNAQAAGPVGRLRDIAEFNAFQWFLLVLSAASLAAVICAAVHCAGHPIRRKWLWFALILLLYARGSISLLEGHLTLKAYVMTPGYSRLLLYPQGGFELAVYLPLGAILYACFGRKRYRAAQGENDGSEAEQTGSSGIGEEPGGSYAGQDALGGESGGPGGWTEAADRPADADVRERSGSQTLKEKAEPWSDENSDGSEW